MAVLSVLRESKWALRVADEAGDVAAGGSDQPPDEAVVVDDADEDVEQKKVHTVKMSIPPVCEYKHNPRLFAGSFPDLFPLGITNGDWGGTGTLRQTAATRLMCHFDQRFSKNIHFVFLLANQKLRHEAVNAVNYRLNNSKENVLEFVDYVNQEGFSERVIEAELNQDGPEAKEILKKLLPLIQMTGSKLKWGPLERRNSISHLYTMAQHHGAPFLFVTFSPKVIENKLCIQFAL